MLKTVESLGDLRGKTVLARVNFDVDSIPDLPGSRTSASVPFGTQSLKAAEVSLPGLRIEQAVLFLKELNQKGARVIILSHRGRPKGKPDPNLSLKPVFEYLKKYFGDKISFKTGDSEILLLENLRFDPREETNDKSFAKELASLGDVYINNDFATSHRPHTSIVSISKFLPAAAGPLVQKEIKELSFLRDFKGPGMVLIMGGAKAETKLKIIDDFLKKGNRVLLGGVLANTLFKKKGLEVGKSVVGEVKDIKDDILESQQVFLPLEVVVSQSIDEPKEVKMRSSDQVGVNEAIVDLADKSIKSFGEQILKAKVVLWNGPLGLIEVEEFKEGSRLMAKVLAAVSVKTIVGGGDLVSFLVKEKMIDKIDYVSTGGGAMLSFLAGEELAGLKSLGYYDE